MFSHAPRLSVSPEFLLLHVRGDGLDWTLERPANLEDLWDGMDGADADDKIPYWTELWPASLALASWLGARRQEISGRLCLDLGCGLGLTALMGQYLGGHVIALDYDRDALFYCSKNALRNQLPPPLCLVQDWRCPALRPGLVSRLWAADILYEKRFIKPVLQFIGHALEPSGLAWIADPGRNFIGAFREESRTHGFESRLAQSDTVDAAYCGARSVGISIWELRRKA